MLVLVTYITLAEFYLAFGKHFCWLFSIISVQLLVVCLSVCLFVCLPVCLVVSLSVCLSVCLVVCLSVCLFGGMFVCLSVSLSVCLFGGLSVCLFGGLFVCLSVHISEKKKLFLNHWVIFLNKSYMYICMLCSQPSHHKKQIKTQKKVRGSGSVLALDLSL